MSTKNYWYTIQFGNGKQTKTKKTGKQNVNKTTKDNEEWKGKKNAFESRQRIHVKSPFGWHIYYDFKRELILNL